MTTTTTSPQAVPFVPPTTAVGLKHLALRAAISDLELRYADGVDRRDHRQLEELFTPDAVFEYDPKDPDRRIAGIENLRAMWQKQKTEYLHLHHLQSAPLVHVDEEAGLIQAQITFRAHHQMPDGTFYTVWARYVDDIVCDESGRVRISYRRVIVHDVVGTDRTYRRLEVVPADA